MARVHEVTDIREVCDALVEELGERALTRDNVQERLKLRAEQRGLGRVGADHQIVYNVIRACKQDLDAARERNRQTLPPDAEDISMPEGFGAVLGRHAQEVERLVRQALTETVRQSAQSAQLQVRQIEVASGELAAELRAQLVMAYEEGERCATQLDEVETALTAARKDLADLSSVAEARQQALHRLESESRAQLAAAQSSIEQAYDARARAEEALHASDLARLVAVGELELARQKMSGLEKEIERTAAVDETAERRAREPERELDVARGTLASVTGERDALRRQIEGVLMQKAAAAPPRPRTTRRSDKKSGAAT
ncbi:MAG: hypothetical protein ACTHQQ_13975 [Solirubrobacteraceae bacterium]